MSIKQTCSKCGHTFQLQWLKDGMCNGCRNPHLIIEAQVTLKPITSKDVIRIVSGQCKGQTGVVNRIDGDNVNIFLKDNSIGVWFNIREIKRIGRIL